MSKLSTEKTEFLKKCFYLSFIETKDYKTNFKPHFDKKGDKMCFKFCDFIKERKESKDTLNLVPIDVLDESECSTETIKRIEEDFNNRTVEGGYSRLLLEYLFDERFKYEFNKFIKNNKYYLLSDSYFKTKSENGIFDYDLVGDYFNKIKDAYRGEEWHFDFTEREAVRSVKSPKASTIGSEKLKNIYSAFKIYGQGVYSGILISLLVNLEKDVKLKGTDIEKIQPEKPEKLFDDCITVITNDSQEEIFYDKKGKYIQESIKSSFSNKIIPGKKNTVVYQTIHDRQVDKVYEQLQRFFEDYVPSHLERVFVFDGVNKGDTLRRQLIRDFRGIAQKKWEKEKLLGKNYENIFDKELMYSKYQCRIIKKEFDKIYKETKNEKKPETIIEKLEYIIKNEADCLKSRTWKRIINMYNIGKPEQYESEEILDRKIENQSDGKLLVDDTETPYIFTGYARKLDILLKIHFKDAPEVVNNCEEQLDSYLCEEQCHKNDNTVKTLINAVRNIKPTLTKTDIKKTLKTVEINEKLNNYVFNFEQLKHPPFSFSKDEIQKTKTLLVLENWKYDCNKHPWYSLFKDCPHNEYVDYKTFTAIMNRIHNNIEEV